MKIDDYYSLKQELEKIKKINLRYERDYNLRKNDINILEKKLANEEAKKDYLIKSDNILQEVENYLLVRSNAITSSERGYVVAKHELEKLSRLIFEAKKFYQEQEKEERV